jgi:hypothetical protein
VETLRAAAPWQTIRRSEMPGAASDARVAVRAADFRLRRFTRRARTTTIFVVDASGSAALHRLAEAKGVVERLLAQCYARRDRVALISFRGRTASLLLPPTASLLRGARFDYSGASRRAMSPATSVSCAIARRFSASASSSWAMPRSTASAPCCASCPICCASAVGAARRLAQRA